MKSAQPLHRLIRVEDEIAEVVDVLRSGWLTTGPKVREFKREFAAMVGAKHAVAVNLSPAYAGSHGCEAVEECATGVLRSRTVAKAVWRVGDLAKEDMLRRVLPKIQKGPRLPVLRSSLLRRVDKAVGLHLPLYPKMTEDELNRVINTVPTLVKKSWR